MKVIFLPKISLGDEAGCFLFKTVGFEYLLTYGLPLTSFFNFGWLTGKVFEDFKTCLKCLQHIIYTIHNVCFCFVFIRVFTAFNYGEHGYANIIKSITLCKSSLCFGAFHPLVQVRLLRLA